MVLGELSHMKAHQGTLSSQFVKLGSEYGTREGQVVEIKAITYSLYGPTVELAASV